VSEIGNENGTENWTKNRALAPGCAVTKTSSGNRILAGCDWARSCAGGNTRRQ
jgi:hypothetical protein